MAPEKKQNELPDLELPDLDEEEEEELEKIVKPKAKKKPEVSLVEVPTAYGLGFSMPDGSIKSSDELLVWIANRVWNIENNLG